MPTARKPASRAAHFERAAQQSACGLLSDSTSAVCLPWASACGKPRTSLEFSPFLRDESHGNEDSECLPRVSPLRGLLISREPLSSPLADFYRTRHPRFACRGLQPAVSLGPVSSSVPSCGMNPTATKTVNAYRA